MKQTAGHRAITAITRMCAALIGRSRAAAASLEPLGKDEVWIRMGQELKQEASDRSEEAQRKSPELSEESWRELEEALRSMHMEEMDKAGEGE